MKVLVVVIEVATALLLAGTGYLFLLAIIGLLFRQKVVKSERDYRFLILVPAHNEADGLRNTIDSLKQLEPRHERRLVVIADNCTDDTADIARKAGAVVLERTNPEQRGKGYALRWGISQFDLDDFDAVVIVDADTTVDRHLLEIMAGSLEHGAAAVQTTYLFTPAHDSAIAELQHLASLVENHFFYKGRALLGLPGLLRGSGMAIRSDILKKEPWDSFSITEDVDYSIKLLRKGHKIEFTTAGTVYSAAVADYDQAATQKTRWASGTFALIRDHFFPLLKAGLRGYPGLIETAGSLFLMSRPLMIYVASILMLLSLLLPSPTRWILAGTNLVCIGGIVIYLLSGVILAENRHKALVAISKIPAYGLWFLGIQIRSMTGHRKNDWERTGRKSDE